MHFVPFAILFTIHHANPSQAVDPLIDNHWIHSDDKKAKYWVRELNCPEESASVCGDSIAISCGVDFYYRSKENRGKKRLIISPTPKRSHMSICLDLDFGYLYSPSDNLYLIQGDSLTQFPGDQFCGVEAKKFNNLIASDLIGMSCSSWGAIFRDQLIFPTGISRRLFSRPEVAIAHWKDSAGEYVLGDHRTKIRITIPKKPTSPKHSNSDARHSPPEITVIAQDKHHNSDSDPLLFFSKECPIKSELYRQTTYFFPFDSSKVGRPGCFFWGKKSNQIYCPRPDGLDSFPRTPDTSTNNLISIQGCDF